ncbi:hypothetical protein OGAPHI_000423 [Ogataea philodendri]|uniref:Protein kinase domain-containing protein n=1 Tax=Ogataea philodendri TaxID=1378263 RepID=A0A9P8T9U4_9ASCO|nr:uncharacterized protein OGAPHI_000423 [Ogataea philodendri]KAH3671718.1 hypothetical protein OGAPHI_000423 [Ogataea philodendri]
MAELHRKISNLSSPSSINRLTSSNSSNITSFPPTSRNQPASQFTSYPADSQITLQSSHALVDDDDSDDDLNERPPMLSSYAITLLQQLTKNTYNVDKRDSSDYKTIFDEPQEQKESMSELSQLDTSRPSSRRFSSFNSNISQPAYLGLEKRYGIETDQSENTASKYRQSLRSARSFSKFGLGAPKRLSESELNELANSPENYGKSPALEHRNEEGKHTATTNMFTKSDKTTTAPTYYDPDREDDPGIGNKHAYVQTPRHERNRPISSCSPRVKRNNLSETPYRADLQLNQAQKTSQLDSTINQKTPTKTPALDRYATPEQARRALTPLSQSRWNQQKSDIFDFHEMKDRLTPKKSYSHDRLGQIDENPRRSVENIQAPVTTKKAWEEREARSSIHQERVYEVEKPSNILTINKQDFECLEQIGKGGSSKVYRARAVNGKRDYAIKVVTFDQFDEGAIVSFKGEIEILRKLRNQDRVVKLIDHSLKEGSLLLVMECGDIDLAHVLASRAHMPFDASFTRYHAVEMVKCVKAVHDAGIVHSDLKPANFLFVKGTLKLIDFGISNSLSDQTVNIYRECQIGTPNYMAPETLIEVNNTLKGDNLNGTWKVGKPADIWSCGCIIYQMVYGKPPYANYAGNKRILAITNPKVEIQYPRVTADGTRVNGLVIDTIQRCLKRNPSLRANADQLLDTDFLRPKVVTHKFINDLVRNAVKYGNTHQLVSDHKLDILVEDVWKKVNEYS